LFTIVFPDKDRVKVSRAKIEVQENHSFYYATHMQNLQDHGIKIDMAARQSWQQREDLMDMNLKKVFKP